jgi:hypothetical protein
MNADAEMSSAVAWDRDVYFAIAPVQKAPQVRGRSMAQDRSLSTGIYRGRFSGEHGEHPMTNVVHPALNAVQTTVCQPVRDCAAAHASGQELCPRHDTVLSGGEFRDLLIAASSYVHNCPTVPFATTCGHLCTLCVHVSPYPSGEAYARDPTHGLRSTPPYLAGFSAPRQPRAQLVAKPALQRHKRDGPPRRAVS